LPFDGVSLHVAMPTRLTHNIALPNHPLSKEKNDVLHPYIHTTVYNNFISMSVLQIVRLFVDVRSVAGIDRNFFAA
jgi:hypothetical protein